MVNRFIRPFHLYTTDHDLTPDAAMRSARFGWLLSKTWMRFGPACSDSTFLALRCILAMGFPFGCCFIQQLENQPQDSFWGTAGATGGRNVVKRDGIYRNG